MQDRDGSADSWPADYIETNRRAYDSLANEYRLRRAADRLRDPAIVNPFRRLLRLQFGSGPLRVLDTGCGAGLNLAMFAEADLRVTGIDISEKMLSVARDSCPDANLIVGDFLSYDFGRRRYHGIFSKAFIHLFTKADAQLVLDKVHRLLLPGGVFYVTTTVGRQQASGLKPKTDYSRPAARYRRTWLESELLRSVQAARLEVVETSYNAEDDREKSWFNIWAVKPKRSGTR